MKPEIEKELPLRIRRKRAVENLYRDIEIDFPACSGNAHPASIIACRRRLRNVERKPHDAVTLGRPQLRRRIETIADEIVFITIKTVLRLRRAHKTRRERLFGQTFAGRGRHRRSRHVELALMDVAPHRDLSMNALALPSCDREPRRFRSAYGRGIYAIVKTEHAAVQSSVDGRLDIGIGQHRSRAQHTRNHRFFHVYLLCLQFFKL